MRRVGIAAALITLAGCPRAPEPATPEPPPPVVDTPIGEVEEVEADPLESALGEATRGVSSEALGLVLRDHWEFTLRERPLMATRLGVRVYDDRLPERSADAIEQRYETKRDLLDRLRTIDDASLDPADRTTKALLQGKLEADIAAHVCAFEQWNVGTQSNPLNRYATIPQIHTLNEERDLQTLVSRYQQIPSRVDDEITLLRSGLEQGLVANAESVRRTVAMIDAELSKPAKKWGLVEPIGPRPESVDDEDWGGFVDIVNALVDEPIRAAMKRYRDVLHDEILPKARPDDRVGVGALPIGKECYAALVRRYTTLSDGPEQVHARGLAEIDKTDAELAELGTTALKTKGLPATLKRLRTDTKLYFNTSHEVERAAVDALDAARKAMPKFFGRLPKADCVVKRVPQYEAPFTTIAYYREPNADGSKPGEYFINVIEPKTRPRYEARVLAVHEAIPGHHLQIAIAQELEAIPAFRRHSGYTAFVEGWALYTERLAEEMDLYRNDLDRIGMVSFDAWRAGRLVVDTGIHAKGWTRQQAIDFLTEHTALSPNNIDNEVDRYIAWPGQALAYKTGQLELWALRRQAESALGDTFSLPAFHDAVLGGGAVSLPVLRARIEAWIAEQKESAD